ncbi:MAG TPA: formate dehydrogenase subunit gamma [Burkholderiales bacterium]|nr:formate dehydrogenase subunit gamma [Burkholderiales bacterium]
MTHPDEPSARATVERAIAATRDLPGPLLGTLQAIQRELGHVPDWAVPMVATALNLSRAEVHGTLTFYHDLRGTPPGRHVVRVCRAESCQAMNGARLEQHIKSRLGIDYHQTTADGALTLEPAYCFGHCACSPAITIDNEPHVGVTPERFDALLEGFAQ